ncbi:hypothetical protein COOONC_00349, partial [Cooperia oncophora]
ERTADEIKSSILTVLINLSLSRTRSSCFLLLRNLFEFDSAPSFSHSHSRCCLFSPNGGSSSFEYRLLRDFGSTFGSVLLRCVLSSMISTRAVLALFYVLLFGIAIVTSAPNRIFMRFGKRAVDPVNYRFPLPGEYIPIELLGTSRFIDGDM